MDLLTISTNPKIQMPKREHIKLERLDGNRNRVTDSDALLIWYDSKQVKSEADEAILSRLTNLKYTGVVFYPENLERLLPVVGGRLERILHVETLEILEALGDLSRFQEGDIPVVVASPNLTVLQKARERKLATCFRAYVDDGKSLHESIDKGSQHDYLMVAFRDPTNIPLELVIASLQATHTVLIKEITNPLDVEDAIVTLGVMEVGADGVMYSPTDHSRLDEFLGKLEAATTPTIKIEVGTVLQSRPVGMGYRSCIDLATLFQPTEGMIVGSTSQGGVLCCPEVFFLPYMELRPFRVNAGAVHSYVYNVEDRTDYMTELRAGAPVMVVDKTGKVRRAVVGRMKTEVRPLRLIEVQFSSGEKVNVILQDDWHVRIFSAEGLPLNITELKPGDKVLGHVAKPGRHVGIKVDEHIVEN
jgi:3-amino-4-hydroxybenzoic acid synthase